MYFRKRLFSDKKTKLVYSNGPSQVHLSYPVNDGNNKTAYKTCLKLLIEKPKKTHTHTQASQGRCCSVYCRTAVAKVKYVMIKKS